MELKERVALVTGGGTGLGRAIALALAREGANVAVNYSRSEAEAEATVRSLRDLGVKATAVRADVGRTDEAEALVERTVAELGRLDVLVNNAGTTEFVDFRDLDRITEAMWDRILDVNVKAIFFLSRAAAGAMRRRGGGSIVNITSISGLRAGGSSIPYSVSKAASTMLTKCLAIALAPEVRVNAVAPGLMDTRWGRAWGEAHLESYAAEAHLRRLPTLDDIAAAVVFVAKNESMTGQTVVVDGGVFFH
ncbi:MAG TPA: glucose 1-dehydrogenase [Chloroflexota bacterium]